jgi:hypothetical protein
MAFRLLQLWKLNEGSLTCENAQQIVTQKFSFSKNMNINISHVYRLKMNSTELMVMKHL